MRFLRAPPRCAFNILQGPELINSRLAMLGFVAALGAELSTHETVISQFRQAPLAIGGVVALITVATVVPIIRGVRRDSFGFLTPSAEVYNGRVAMLG